MEDDIPLPVKIQKVTFFRFDGIRALEIVRDKIVHLPIRTTVKDEVQQRFGVNLLDTKSYDYCCEVREERAEGSGENPVLVLAFRIKKTPTWRSAPRKVQL